MERPAEIDVAPLLLPNKVEIGGGRGGGCGDDGESDVGCEPRRTFSEDGSWREGRRSLSRLSGQEVFEHMGLGRFISIDEGRPRSQQILHDRRKSVNLLCLTILIFYSVSGGPFGIEGAVSAAGPFLTLLGLIILPFVWAIPEAMVTAELSAAFPDPSGFVGWVAAAFGTYWGFMEGYWSWLSGVADNSLYAVLLLDYFLQLVGEDGRGSSLASGLPRVCFLLLTCAILTCLNLLGLRIVGNVALTICIFSLLPFAIMVAWGGSGYSHPENWFNLPEGGWGAVKWGTFLNIIFWNTNYVCGCFVVLSLIIAV
jgi:amino acid transporter